MFYWALVLLRNLLLFVKYLFRITLVGWLRFHFHRDLQRSFSNILNLSQIPFLCRLLRFSWSGKRKKNFSSNHTGRILRMNKITSKVWSEDKHHTGDLLLYRVGLCLGSLEMCSRCPADSLFDLVQGLSSLYVANEQKNVNIPTFFNGNFWINNLF